MSARVSSILTPPREPTTAHAIAIAAVVATVALLVYLTGGTQTALPQTMYLPLTAAAWCFGSRGGLIAGVCAGLLLGPLMPLNVEQDIAQDPVNWMIRLSVLSFLGLALGFGANNRLHQLSELQHLNEESIRAFVNTIDAKCKHTAEHSESVAEHAVQIGRSLGLDAERISQLRWEALLHDIGKLTVPDSILNKSGKLTGDEWKVIERHPVESVRMLQGVRHFRPYLPAVRHHHERYDGTGYPDRIAGEEIPLHARILAVADSYDAMTSTRPYRAALSREEALKEICAGAGTQFDPTIVRAFLRSMVERYPRQRDVHKQVFASHKTIYPT